MEHRKADFEEEPTATWKEYFAVGVVYVLIWSGVIYAIVYLGGDS